MSATTERGSNATAVVAVIIASVALIVACVALGVALRPTHHDAAAPPPPRAQSIAVDEHEYAITAPASATPGPATFTVTNTGNATHEFVLIKTDLPDDNLPRAADGRVDINAPGLVPVGSAEGIVSDYAATVSAALTPGHYVMICNVTGHYAAGMHAGFTVTA